MASEGLGLQARAVTFAYDGDPVVRHVSLLVKRGAMVALLGPNGSGKTTLLNVMGGWLRASSGDVVIDGQALGSFKPKARARALARVSQHVDHRLDFTVEALVAMGRTPHGSLFGTLNRDDQQAIHSALEAADLVTMRERRFDELSGGEQQRVMLAMALAQETDYLLLDEPTVHLDIHHQRELLELLKRLQQERKLGILAAMHDLNLAALYFDQLAVLHEGVLVTVASPEEALRNEEVLRTFQAPLTVIEHPRTGAPQVLLDREI